MKQGKYLSVMAIIMAITLAWNLFGFADGFFLRTWAESISVPVTPISYGANAALIAMLALLALERKWSVQGSMFAGIFMAVWSAIGLYFTPKEAILAATLPGFTGTAVPMILGGALATLGIIVLTADHNRKLKIIESIPLSKANFIKE